jgi:hypothetical protein
MSEFDIKTERTYITILKNILKKFLFISRSINKISQVYNF